uniref:Uncharacterized protein n=1 Tax=viral metagenome TaxID=1070528 RepID=A0A6C0BN31_9ZZZZ
MKAYHRKLRSAKTATQPRQIDLRAKLAKNTKTADRLRRKAVLGMYPKKQELKRFFQHPKILDILSNDFAVFRQLINGEHKLLVQDLSRKLCPQAFDDSVQQIEDQEQEKEDAEAKNMAKMQYLMLSKREYPEYELSHSRGMRNGTKTGQLIYVEKVSRGYIIAKYVDTIVPETVRVKFDKRYFGDDVLSWDTATRQFYIPLGDIDHASAAFYETQDYILPELSLVVANYL